MTITRLSALDRIVRKLQASQDTNQSLQEAFRLMLIDALAARGRRAALAAGLGVSPGYISHLLDGRKRVSAEQAARIVAVLHKM